jgi:galactose mutarotase-like enzyme
VSATVEVVRWRGAAALRLRAGEFEAVVVPELSMLIASLRWREHEHVALAGGLAAYRAGHTTGIPLLHPWANRLSRRRYRAAGTDVDLRGLALHTDGNGLPIHGTMAARAGWDVRNVRAARSSARVVARFPFGAHEDLLASFPFPHDLEIAVELGPGGLHVTTSVEPTAGVPVPISFGWHPYWRLPSPRAGWELDLPARERWWLDRRGIPTGRRSAGPAGSVALDGADLDHHFALGDDRSFRVRDRRRELRIEFDAAYPFAQVYAPPGAAAVAVEPMTAPVDALVTGEHPTVAPGDVFRAAFRARAGALRG